MSKLDPSQVELARTPKHNEHTCAECVIQAELRLGAQIDAMRLELRLLQERTDTLLNPSASIDELANLSVRRQSVDHVIQHTPGAEQTNRVRPTSETSQRLISMKHEVEALSASFRDIAQNAPRHNTERPCWASADAEDVEVQHSVTRLLAHPEFVSVQQRLDLLDQCLQETKNLAEQSHNLANQTHKDGKVFSLRLELVEQGLASAGGTHCQFDQSLGFHRHAWNDKDQQIRLVESDAHKLLVGSPSHTPLETQVGSRHHFDDSGEASHVAQQQYGSGMQSWRDQAERRVSSKEGPSSETPIASVSSHTAAGTQDKVCIGKSEERTRKDQPPPGGSAKCVQQPRVPEALTTRMTRVENEVHTLAASLREIKTCAQHVNELQTFVKRFDASDAQSPGYGRCTITEVHEKQVSSRPVHVVQAGLGEDEVQSLIARIVACEQIASIQLRFDELQSDLADVRVAARANSSLAPEVQACESRITDVESRLGADLGAMEFSLRSLQDKVDSTKDLRCVVEDLRQVIHDMLPRVIQHEESIERELAEAKQAIEHARSTAEADGRELVQKLSHHLGSVEELVARGRGTAAEASQGMLNVPDLQRC